MLLFFIAGWAIATGVFQIIGAIKLRKEIDNEWLLILGGIISVLFGVGMMMAPGAGALALVWVIGAYSVVDGRDPGCVGVPAEEARPRLTAGCSLVSPARGIRLIHWRRGWRRSRRR